MTKQEQTQLQKLAQQTAVQTEILERLENGLSEVREYIVGKPDHPGLILRVDRLEVVAKWKTTILKLIGGALAGGIFTWIASKL